MRETKSFVRSGVVVLSVSVCVCLYAPAPVLAYMLVCWECVAGELRFQREDTQSQ